MLLVGSSIEECGGDQRIVLCSASAMIRSRYDTLCLHSLGADRFRTVIYLLAFTQQELDDPRQRSTGARIAYFRVLPKGGPYS